VIIFTLKQEKKVTFKKFKIMPFRIYRCSKSWRHRQKWRKRCWFSKSYPIHLRKAMFWLKDCRTDTFRNLRISLWRN